MSKRKRFLLSILVPVMIATVLAWPISMFMEARGYGMVPIFLASLVVSFAFYGIYDIWTKRWLGGTRGDQHKETKTRKRY